MDVKALEKSIYDCISTQNRESDLVIEKAMSYRSGYQDAAMDIIKILPRFAEKPPADAGERSGEDG
jgi:hypothetical protein